MIDENRIQSIKIEDIIPNRFQPRERFDEDGLEDLAKSIKEHGVIQPIIVRKLGDKYELIAGERRTRASSLAGLTTIPAIIREMDDKESAKISLLENLQRKNLTAIEEAKTYKRVLELDNITQDELAKTMGRSQPMIANKLRLLSLPEEIQDALVKNQISERHARSLLTLKDKRDQLLFLDRTKKERLTVRELDKEIKKYKENKGNILEENDKENIMNNNRSNFGGMGLNDYQSGVGNNMFNNIPNNFSNMATPVSENNQMENYDFGEINSNNDNSFNNQSFSDGNNGINMANNESLGSMFDGGMPQQNNMSSPMNNVDNNVFMSQIREDNVPKKENQFLPNFDDDMNSNVQMEAQNNFNNSNFMSQMDNNYSNNMDSMNYDNPMNNNYMNNSNLMGQNQYMDSNAGMNNYQPPMNNMNQFNNNYQGGINPNDFYVNPNYQTNMNQTNNQMSMGMPDMSANPMNMGQPMPFEQNQQFVSQVNNDYAMNGIDSYNAFNIQSDNRIPDFGNGGNFYQNPNGGNLFNQPLNIVGPYGGDSTPQSQMVPEKPIQQPFNQPPMNEQLMPPSYNEPPMVEQSESQSYNDSFNPTEKNMPEQEEMPKEEQPFEGPTETNYEQPISLDIPKEETTEESEAPVEEQEVKKNPVDIPDIEVIDNSEVTIPTENKEEKQEYIRLDDEITMHNAHDAVLELKKTTDKIKQNHIDIDTEEVEFDDVYQITIKIKKEEN